jgi:hypothetical protein
MLAASESYDAITATTSIKHETTTELKCRKSAGADFFVLSITGLLAKTLSAGCLLLLLLLLPIQMHTSQATISPLA